MREPEVGISNSTDSHVFFYVYMPNLGESIGHVNFYCMFFESRDCGSVNYNYSFTSIGNHCGRVRTDIVSLSV